MNRIEIRPAAEADAAAMLDIYGPYVEKTTVSSEYEAPSMEEFCRRIRTFTAQLPWLVCSIDGQVAGYGYASRIVPARHINGRLRPRFMSRPNFIAAAWHARCIRRCLNCCACRDTITSMSGLPRPMSAASSSTRQWALSFRARTRTACINLASGATSCGWARSCASDGEPQPTVAFPELRDTAMCARVLKEAAAKIRRKKDESTIAGSAELC